MVSHNINGDTMKLKKGATISLFLSIWAGLIVVGFLTGTNMIAENIIELSTHPANALYNMFVRAFTNPLFIGLMVGTSVLAGGFAVFSGGNNFSVLYILPMAIILTLLNIFLLPTGVLTSETVSAPSEIQVLYTLFIGLLTVATVVSFTSGR